MKEIICCSYQQRRLWWSWVSLCGCYYWHAGSAVMIAFKDLWLSAMACGGRTARDDIFSRVVSRLPKVKEHNLEHLCRRCAGDCLVRHRTYVLLDPCIYCFVCETSYIRLGGLLPFYSRLFCADSEYGEHHIRVANTTTL